MIILEYKHSIWALKEHVANMQNRLYILRKYSMYNQIEKNNQDIWVSYFMLLKYKIDIIFKHLLAQSDIVMCMDINIL